MNAAILAASLGLATFANAAPIRQPSALCWQGDAPNSTACLADMARVVRTGHAPASTVSEMLAAVQGARSERHVADFLVALAEEYRLDPAQQRDYLRAAATVSNDTQLHRVLSNLIEHHDVATHHMPALLRTAATIGRDEPLAQLLVQIAGTHTLSVEAERAFLAAAERVQDARLRREVDRAASSMFASVRRM